MRLIIHEKKKKERESIQGRGSQINNNIQRVPGTCLIINKTTRCKSDKEIKDVNYIIY